MIGRFLCLTRYFYCVIIFQVVYERGVFVSNKTININGYSIELKNDNDIETKIVMPVYDNFNIVNKLSNACDLIALYGDFEEGKRNVGYPAVAAYVPVFANMWGYDEAKDKQLYLNINPDKVKYLDNTEVYKIVINKHRNIVTEFIKLPINKKEENNEETKIVKLEDIKTRKRALN